MAGVQETPQAWCVASWHYYPPTQSRGGLAHNMLVPGMWDSAICWHQVKPNNIYQTPGKVFAWRSCHFSGHWTQRDPSDLRVIVIAAALDRLWCKSRQHVEMLAAKWYDRNAASVGRLVKDGGWKPSFRTLQHSQEGQFRSLWSVMIANGCMAHARTMQDPRKSGIALIGFGGQPLPSNWTACACPEGCLRSETTCTVFFLEDLKLRCSRHFLAQPEWDVRCIYLAGTDLQSWGRLGA